MKFIERMNEQRWSWFMLLGTGAIVGYLLYLVGNGMTWQSRAPLPAKRSIVADVRAAIAAFLNQCQNEAKPFAGAEALGAIRMMFPELDISDADLEDAIFSEAANAGFDVGYEPRTGSAKMKQKALERWERGTKVE